MSFNYLDVVSMFESHVQAEGLDESTGQAVLKLLHNASLNLANEALMLNEVGDAFYQSLIGLIHVNWIDFVCEGNRALSQYVELNEHLTLLHQFFQKNGIYTETTLRQFMMPSVINWTEEEVVSSERYQNLPLDTLVLSEKGSRVMYVDTAIQHAEINKKGFLFEYNNSHKPREYTAKEYDRISVTNPVMWEKYQNLLLRYASDEGYRVSRATILRIAQLIEQSVYASGVSGTYNAREQQSSEIAYSIFREYLKAVSAQEYDALMKQVIRYDAHAQCLGNSLSEAFNDNFCITTLGKELCKLVLDYEPDFQFHNKTINKWITLYKLRENSAEKSYDETNCFRDYEGAEDYFLQRLVRLYAVLLNENFSLWGGGAHISRVGYSNTVSKTCKEIIAKIEVAFISGEYQSCFFELHKNVLYEAQRHPSRSRTETTQQLFADIYYEQIYINKSLSYIETLALASQISAEIETKTLCSRAALEIRKKIHNALVCYRTASKIEQRLHAAMILAEAERVYTESSVEYEQGRTKGEEESEQYALIKCNASIDTLTENMQPKAANTELVGGLLNKIFLQIFINSSYKIKFFESGVTHQKIQELKSACLQYVMQYDLNFNQSLLASYIFLSGLQSEIHFPEALLNRIKTFVFLFTGADEYQVSALEAELPDRVLVAETGEVTDDFSSDVTETRIVDRLSLTSLSTLQLCQKQAKEKELVSEAETEPQIISLSA